MKRKRNHSLRSSVFIFLAALFLLFTCSVSTIYASTLQKPDIAASGKFVKDGDYWIYRYDDKTIAKNVFLKIDKKTYYFNFSNANFPDAAAGAAGIRSKAKIIISEPDLRDI